MLYGMSFVYGMANSTVLTDISRYAATNTPALFAAAIFLTLVGFAFKVERGAVPLLGARHLRGRADAGHRVPLGRVEGRRLRRAAHDRASSASSRPIDSWQPILWVLAAASMTLGNLAALRQTNAIRMLAYSSIAQGGFILVPLAVAGDVRGNSAWEAVVIYLLIYGAMNLGAFAAVIAAARRTRLGGDLELLRARDAPIPRSR